jgi:hypothetical protein
MYECEMKRLIVGFFLLGVPSLARADALSIPIAPALAPNAFGTNPSAYQAMTAATARQVIASGVPCWEPVEDPGGTGLWDTSGSFGANPFGFNYGAGQTSGAMDDILFTSGSGAASIDGLSCAGVGGAFGARLAGTGLDKLDKTALYISSSAATTIDTVHTDAVDQVNGSVERSFALAADEPASTPLPSTALGGFALLALAGLGRRRVTTA